MKSKNKITIFAFMLVVAIFFGGCSFLFDTNEALNVSQTDKDQAILDIAESYVEAVVTIKVVNSTETQIALGSGVAIYEGGYIATNYHVVSYVLENTEYSLQVQLNNNTNYSGEVLWSNPQLDVAVVKIANPNLKYVKMQDRFIYSSKANSLKALETVIAIGTPLDISLQNTVTLGYIASAEARISHTNSNVYEHLIQHTSPINHGNSGGGLFDINGNLIGLNTLGNDDAHSIFFAVPIYPFTVVIDKIVSAYESENEFKLGRLGILAQDRYQAALDEESSFEGTGLLVMDVEVNGPSENLLEAGDIIKKVKVGQRDFIVNVRNDFIYSLLNANVGQTISLTVARDGISIIRQIVLG